MKRKNFFKMFRNHKGFSLMEVIVAIAIIGAGSYIIMNTSNVINKQGKAMTVTPVVSRLNLNLVGKLKRILTDTVGADGKHVEGICKLISSNASSPGVGAVFITTFPKVGGEPFPDSRWDKYVGDGWTRVSSSGTDCSVTNNYTKCYRMKDDTNLGLSDRKTKDLNVVVELSIIPLNMNPYKAGEYLEMFGELGLRSNYTSDVKDIGFKLIANVTYNMEEGKRSGKKFDDFIWAPSVGTCDYTLPKGEKVKLSLSGAGASDKDGNTVYNRSGFTGNKQDPLRVIFRKTQVQKGKLTNNGQFLQSDTNENIFGSCNERKFRCPQENSNERTYDPIDMRMNLTYFPDNKLVPFFATQMTFNPQLKMQKGEGRDLVEDTPSNIGYLFDGRRYSWDNSSNSYKLVDANSQDPMIVNGSHVLQVAISDKENSNQANSLCRQICRSDTNYNTSGNTYVDRYSPYLNYSFKGYNEEFKLASNQGLGCTACYMKGCDRLGLDTFGPMAKQPYQPLDAGLPECSIKEPAGVVYNMNPYKDFSKEGSGWSEDSKNCIAAKLSYDQSKMIFYAENCSSSLPVMCFNYGKFLLARDISSGNEALSKVTFDNAPERCFKMGKESVPTQSLEDYLESTVLPFPKVGGNYEFVNLAEQGAFIAPQIQKDIKDYNAWRMDRGVSTSQKFWVSLKKDSGANMVSSIPFMSASLNDNHGVFFDGRGVLTFREYPKSLGLDSSGSDKGLLLFHHVKFKGAVAVKNNGPNNEVKYKFLCRKKTAPFSFYISEDASRRQVDGIAICESSGGKFLPPTTSIGWVKALLMTKPNHANYPFPDPKVTSLDNIKGIWIGLQDSGDGRGWRLMNSDRIKSIGSFKHYEPMAEDKVEIINGLGEYINPRAMVKSGFISEKKVDIPAKGKFKVSVDQIYNFTLELNDNETDTKEMTLDEIANKFNGSTNKVRMRVKQKNGDGDYQLIVESQSTDVDSMVEIQNGNSNSVLKFTTGEKNQAPNPNKLCYDDSQYEFGKIPKKGYCKNSPSVSGIKNGIVYGSLWEFGGYSEFERFVFYK